MLFSFSLWAVGIFVIVISVGVFFGGIVHGGGITHERIRTVANIVSAGAAVTIPIVVADVAASSRANEISLADQARLSDANTAKDTRTLETMTKLNESVSKLVSLKVDHDMETEPDRYAKSILGDGAEAISARKYLVSYDYINKSQDKLVRWVIGILNEYEAVCLGVNQGLLSAPIVWSMRGDALIATFTDYGPYILEYRQTRKVRENAWKNCESLTEELRANREALKTKASQAKDLQYVLLRKYAASR